MSVRKRKDGRWGYDIKKRSAGRVVLRERKFGFSTAKAARAAEEARRATLTTSGPKPPTTKALTFAELTEEVLLLHANVNNKASERASKRSIFEQHPVPYFGDTA